MRNSILIVLLSTFAIGSINAQELYSKDAQLVKLAGEFKFTEGPVSDANGTIYFSDIPEQIIYKYTVSDGFSVFMDNVPGCNGLFFDRDSNLVVCGNSQSQSVWRINMKTMSIDTLAHTLEGVPFNGPNDLWIDHKNGIYFTDPLYGKRNAETPKLASQDVYYIEPKTGDLKIVINDFVRPNGIIATLNGKRMYVADIGDEKVYVYNVAKDGLLKHKKLFASEGCDGMTMDKAGNLYFTNSNIKVYDKKGHKIAEIDVPERPANVCFGGTDKKTLFITARTGVYAIKMNIAGAY